ncbi:indole-3-glycerol phosphate synthase TrpC [Helicobacter sp. T3_23-1056]
MDILAKIIKSTKARVEREKTQISFNEMRSKAESLYKMQIAQCERESSVILENESSVDSSLRASAERERGNPLDSSIKPPFAFENALDSRVDSSQNSVDSRHTMRFICEVKKASPSKGIIAQDFPYLQIARDYEAAGADCISCLTEPEYFLGADSYLREIAKAVKIPTLRKDFIIDSYMIYGAKVLGADCVLLISEALELAQMVEFCDIAKSLGLSVLIESHSESALQNALQTSAKLIGVNNRDLRSFKVDLGTSIRLKRLVPKDRIFVSESGIATREDIALLESHDINAVLIGESLMRKSNKIHALANLKGKKL